MYAESSHTIIFSAVLLRVAYFLPRLLHDLKISPFVPFLPQVPSEEGVDKVSTLHAAF